MFDFVRNLFRKEDENLPEVPVEPPDITVPKARPLTSAPPEGVAFPKPGDLKMPVGGFDPEQEPPITLPLVALVGHLPDTLKDLVDATPPKAVTVEIPIPDIQQQLKSGAVRVPFGVLRNASPRSIFKPEAASSDDVPVTLPLQQILQQVWLKKRTNQLITKVPEEIVPVFKLQSAEPVTAAPEPPPTPPAVSLKPQAEPPVKSDQGPMLRLARDDSEPLPDPHAPPKVGPPAPAPEKEEPAFPMVSLDIDPDEFEDDLSVSSIEVQAEPSEEPSTPASLVAAARKLDGVEGVILVSHDGLTIESDMPENVDARVFSAFLPEIMVRTRVYLTEMNLPEPDSLIVNAGDQKLMIFAVKRLFLGVLTMPEASLPVAALRNIVTDIEKHATDF